jgi:hypothetical protein
MQSESIRKYAEMFQLEELLREDAAVEAILVVFAVDDPGSLHEAEKMLKQLAAKHFLSTQVERA